MAHAFHRKIAGLAGDRRHAAVRLLGFAQLSDDAAQSHWLPALAGTILIVAGAYQFTGWKKASIFVLFFVEKHWKHGIVLAKIAGGALMALGAAVIARPAVLALISQ
jgi:predicted metal-binding membrane protein